MKFPKSIFSGYHGSCHCQGIAVDEKKGYIYYSFTTKLVKTDLDGNLIGSVDGLIGHLGCIDFCERDGRVYGSLEYKNDAIGRNILKTLKLDDSNINNAFYCVIFDVDKINSINMDAESDGIMRAVYLPEPLRDYEGSAIINGEELLHKYACSGIDGLGFGPEWGKTDGDDYLRICYGIYGDVSREDNDYQIILTFDARDWWDSIAKPLLQNEMHKSGDVSISKCFVKTGNTVFGIQNLEYDAYNKCWMLAVYRGKKTHFKNYDMFFIPATAKPSPTLHSVYGEEILEIQPYEDGIYFPYGSTGMYAFGDGRYYFSAASRHPELGQYTNVLLYRASEGNTSHFDAAEE